ncbi:MAG: hypothetical protein LBI63_04065 [Candidatus Ancillula sp.]|nr:hypothetical protein [Candidatus Ancillula sp.]
MRRNVDENKIENAPKKKRCKKFFWIFTGVAAIVGLKKVLDKKPQVDDEIATSEEDGLKDAE